MSTTPSTPERPAYTYTVIGGARQDRILAAPFRTTLLLLNRGPRFDRAEALREAEALDVDEIVSVERAAFEVDTLSKEHPRVRFLLAPAVPSVGELVDIGVTEARSRFVLVAWSDMRIEGPESVGAAVDAAERSGAVVVSPELAGPDGGAIPSASSPALAGSRFAVSHAQPAGEQCATLYPFDYCGIYRKDRFLGLGGYDAQVAAPYWQKLELGLLAHLWGESLAVRRELRLSYRGEIPTEDTTPNASYRRFYLTTVAARLGRDGAYLPLARLAPFVARSGAPLATAVREFREARRWIGDHRRQYRLDVKGLLETWGSIA